MVHFKDDDKDNLVILSHADEDIKEGLFLSVARPIYGRFSPFWPKFSHPQDLIKWSLKPTSISQNADCLLSYLHSDDSNDTPFITLGSRIIEGVSHWGQPFNISGEFAFIPKYWEWTEDILSRCSVQLNEAHLVDAVYASLYTYDRNTNIVRAFCENWCPVTNTVHLRDGEASISLWDLHQLGGLPIKGEFYDEVVPCTKELIGHDATGRGYLPRGCEYLFAAFHYLRKEREDQRKVLITDWINFWFQGDLPYAANSILLFPRNFFGSSYTSSRVF